MSPHNPAEGGPWPMWCNKFAGARVQSRPRQDRLL